MTEVKFMFDYGTPPVWVMNEKEGIFAPKLPEEVADDSELTIPLQEIHEGYMALFINTRIEFGYKGFESEEERQSFIAKVNSFIELLKEKLEEKAKGKYYVTVPFPIEGDLTLN